MSSDRCYATQWLRGFNLVRCNMSLHDCITSNHLRPNIKLSFLCFACTFFITAKFCCNDSSVTLPPRQRRRLHRGHRRSRRHGPPG